MLKRIIDWAVANRLIVLLLTAAATVGGVVAVRRTPLEALPDLSDVQVIVQADYNEQAPRIVEDQVTYPVAAEMLKVPGARTVRGYSFFGVSFVYVIFEDGTDLYWARTRVLEYLNGIRGRLPASVTPTLGPDATGLGWVYQYALEDTTGRLDLAQLRGVQDWYLRYALTAVPGVSEVASVGGFEKQYQVDIDPAKLLAYGIPVTRVMSDIQSANADVGAMTMELSEREYMVRGLGYLRSIGDIENVVVGATAAGTPIRVAELGLVAPDASVTLAHAWPGVPAVAPALTGWEQAYERALPELFERARREIGAPETMQVETVTLTGRSPGRAVAGFAAAAGADLVVSATHGHGFVARLVLGSVAAELLRGAPCSFLCVPGSATTHAAARETVPSTA